MRHRFQWDTNFLGYKYFTDFGFMIQNFICIYIDN